MNIGDLIYKRRKALNLTLEQVGNAVGVSKSTVKKWESGYISNMRRDKIALLAKVLQIKPTELIDDTLDIVNPKKIYQVPVFESVSAGFGALAENEIIDYIPVVIDNPYDVPSTIAIKVAGDSMYPKIEDGDIIIVRKQASVDSGDIAVLLLDDNEGLVKRVVYGDTWIELHSINPEYKTRRFDEADVLRLKVVGKVIGSYKAF